MQTFRHRAYLGDLARIPIYADVSALLLLLLCWHYMGSWGTAPFVIGLLVLLAGIVLHELGHGLAARAQGAFGVEVTLWALGGVCSSFRDMLPRREIIILVAGPLVSYLLAVVSLVVGNLLLHVAPHLLYHHHVILEGLAAPADQAWWLDHLRWLPFIPNALTTLGMLLSLGFAINLILGIFNSLPIFPLDGGQVLFNVLRLLFRRDRIAARVTLVVTVVMAVGYLLWSSWNPTSQSFDRFSAQRFLIIGWVLANAFMYLR